MQIKKQRILGKLMTLLCVTATMSYATNTRTNVTSMGIQSKTTEFISVSTVYQHMSTLELEKEVEKLTLNGDVPFDMGVELMKRWTQG